MVDFAKSVGAALIVALLVLGGSTARAVEGEAMPKHGSETGFVPYSSIDLSGNLDGVKPFDGLPKPLRGFIYRQEPIKLCRFVEGNAIYDFCLRPGDWTLRSASCRYDIRDRGFESGCVVTCEPGASDGERSRVKRECEIALEQEVSSLARKLRSLPFFASPFQFVPHGGFAVSMPAPGTSEHDACIEVERRRLDETQIEFIDPDLALYVLEECGLLKTESRSETISPAEWGLTLIDRK